MSIMQPKSKSIITVAIAGLLGLTALVLPAAAETVYFDDFNDQQNLNAGGSYTQTLAGSTTTTGGGTWLAGVETGGWGQRNWDGTSGVATPTSSNFLAFTPDPGRIYTVQATIDTTLLNGADPGGTNSWFALGFTSSQHNWNGVDAGTIDTGHLVRWNSNQVSTITYTVNGSTLQTGSIAYVGWITDRAGVVNLTPSNAQVKIDNFTLISGVANPTVTYDGNGSDGGTVPTDGSSPYAHSATVTVLGAGTMTRTGFNFIGWNTAADGNGTDYSESATFTIYDNTTLYAKWLPNNLVTLTYNGNGSTGGSAPTDPSSPYTSGATATVLGNTGNLTKNSYSFNGWNTAANGGGTSYNPAATFTINANTTLFAQWTPGPDYVWNNGAATDNWNTTDANWSGATWDNSGSNNAFFTTVGGSVFLDPGIVTGAVNVGNVGINFASVSLIDGDLSASSLTVQGLGTNAGNYGINPTLTVDSAVTVSGDAAVGRANLNISGGTFTADRIISAPASADWARLVVSGGIATAANGVDGSVNTSATFAIDLNGGELRTPSIKVADREAGTNNNAWLTFNGGTLKAIGADNSNFIQLYGGAGNTYVASGGAVIDTNGLNIGILANLLNGGGGGGLIKEGAGTLTLGAASNYTGNTVINDGALNASSGSSMTFYPAESGVTNSVSAGASTATLSFLGNVYLDLGSVNITDGNNWTLFDLASFTGPQTLTPAAVTSTVGTFGKSGTTWTLVDGDNTWNFEESTGVLSLAVVTSTPYETWGLPYGLTAGSEGLDLDNDGVTNFEEFAFGLIPNSGSSANPITVQLNKTSGQFTYQRLAASGLTYTIWYSTDLATWTEDTTAVQGTPTPSGDNETVEVTLTAGLLSNPKLFIQVRAN
jgi:uncharacterized repeat protein (TIGR02543 family)